jgi:hypothetical protein
VWFVTFFGQRPAVLRIGEVDRLDARGVLERRGDVPPGRPAVLGPVDALVGPRPAFGAGDHRVFEEVARAFRLRRGRGGCDQEERAEKQRQEAPGHETHVPGAAVRSPLRVAAFGELDSLPRPSARSFAGDRDGAGVGTAGLGVTA